jgi:putative phosphoesterase
VYAVDRQVALLGESRGASTASAYWDMGSKRRCAGTASASQPATDARAKRQRHKSPASAALAAPASTLPAMHAVAKPLATVAAIADTHGVLDDQLLAQLRNVGAVDHVLHMGDIGDARASRLSGLTVLERLREFGGTSTPVTAVAGNVDASEKALMAKLPYSKLVHLAGWRLLLVHGHLDGLKISAHGVMDEGLVVRAIKERADVVLFGHSHKPLVARRGVGAMPLPIDPDEGTWSVSRSSSASSGEDLVLLNPGSAGPRRFKLPRCWFVLRLHESRIDIERRDIGVPK